MGSKYLATISSLLGVAKEEKGRERELGIVADRLRLGFFCERNSQEKWAWSFISL